MADHFTDGFDTEPMVASLPRRWPPTACGCDRRILGVDYRHPVLVRRMAATLDVVSEGATLGSAPAG